MALQAKHKDSVFGVGDVVRVHQHVKESASGDKTRIQVFEGTVIGIKNHGQGKSFTVRKIGAQKIGIEQIYPLATPALEKIEVVKHGTRGVRQAKLYYTRNKSKKEIEGIYSRTNKKENKEFVDKKYKKEEKKAEAKPKKVSAKKPVKKTSKKKAVEKAAKSPKK